MKNRSTRKNKTRNFRKKNRGGTKGKKPTAAAKSNMSNMIAKASDTSSHTARPVNLTHMPHASRPIGAGDENKVYVMGFWNPRWTKTLETVISPELFEYMNLEKDEENVNKTLSEKNLLLYHIYWKAHNLVYPFPGTKIEEVKKEIIPLINEFISRYANDYTGEKLNPEYI